MLTYLKKKGECACLRVSLTITTVIKTLLWLPLKRTCELFPCQKGPVKKGTAGMCYFLRAAAGTLVEAGDSNKGKLGKDIVNERKRQHSNGSPCGIRMVSSRMFLFFSPTDSEDPKRRLMSTVPHDSSHPFSKEDYSNGSLK